MKKIAFCIILLPLFSLGQNIPHKTNTIIIAGCNKAAIKAQLQSKSWIMVDRDSSYFETLPRQFKEANNESVIIEVRQKDSLTFLITGRFVSTYPATPGDYLTGVKWKPARYGYEYDDVRDAFNVMLKAVSGIKGQITYSKL